MFTGKTTTGRLTFLLTRSQYVLNLFHTQKILHSLITQNGLYMYLVPRTDLSHKYLEGIAIDSSSFLLRIASTSPRHSTLFYTTDGRSIQNRERRVLLWLRFSKKLEELLTLMAGRDDDKKTL